MTIVIVGLLMGESDDVLQEKCKKVVIVDGVEVNPLKEEEVAVEGEEEQQKNRAENGGDDLDGIPL